MNDKGWFMQGIQWDSDDPIEKAHKYMSTDDYEQRALTEQEWTTIANPTAASMNAKWVLWAGPFGWRAAKKYTTWDDEDDHIYMWSTIMSPTATVRDVLVTLSTRRCYHYFEGIRRKKIPRGCLLEKWENEDEIELTWEALFGT
jgi:hypothetical protein